VHSQNIAVNGSHRPYFPKRRFELVDLRLLLVQIRTGVFISEQELRVTAVGVRGYLL
jgi:hypothetical protein